MVSVDDITCAINNLKVQDSLKAIWENEVCKAWIKMLPIDKELTLDSFELSKDFVKVADIVLDDEVNKKGNKTRSTLIMSVPLEDIDWSNSCEYLYMFVLDGKIVKIGGTRTGLKERISSYLCGHHIKERGKSGKCSVTNANIYNTFHFYLQHGFKIEMYGYKLPVHTVKISLFDEVIETPAQTYHIYEAKYLNAYKKITGSYPCLSDNADPNHK